MDEQLLELARRAKGFMPDAEGLALHRAGYRAAGSGYGPLLEVGTYCGKSAIYLGAAARLASSVLFTVDHHRGSEENQAGWEHHDRSLIDSETGRMDTLPTFRRTMAEAGLEDVVVAVIGSSPVVARHWSTPLSMVFIDGGHGSAPAWADYDGWVPHIALGGRLAIHDVFPNPDDGGRPPFELYTQAMESGAFAEEDSCGSLRVLQRVGEGR